MSHFAKVVDGIVEQVLVVEQDFIDSGALGDPAQWVQTSYNTYGGVHRTGGTPLRKNYAGIGSTYDVQKDAFIHPKTFPSWLLDENTFLWGAPVPYPADGKDYGWDEATLSWVTTA
jgi:hypothetical protein